MAAPGLLFGRLAFDLAGPAFYLAGPGFLFVLARRGTPWASDGYLLTWKKSSRKLSSVAGQPPAIGAERAGQVMGIFLPRKIQAEN